MLKVFSTICLSLPSGLQMLSTNRLSLVLTVSLRNITVMVGLNNRVHPGLATVSGLLVKESDGTPHHAHHARR